MCDLHPSVILIFLLISTMSVAWKKVISKIIDTAKLLEREREREKDREIMF